MKGDLSWLLTIVLTICIFTRQVVNWKCVLQHLHTACNHSKHPSPFATQVDFSNTKC